MPEPVALFAAALAGALIWRRVPSRRDHATAWARDILGEGASEREVRRLGRAAVIEWAVKEEVFWRVDDAKRAPVVGREHLDAALAKGRGAILTFPHVGPIFIVGYVLGAAGYSPMFARLGGAELKRDLRGYGGRRKAHLMREFPAAGSRWVKMGGSFDVLAAGLRRGDVVAAASDAWGSTEGELLGRSALLRSGAAALAMETGAPVIRCYAERKGLRVRFVILPPLEPSDFATMQEIHAEITRFTDERYRAVPAGIYPHPPPFRERVLERRAKEEAQAAKREVRRRKSERRAEKLEAKRLKAERRAAKESRQGSTTRPGS